MSTTPHSSPATDGHGFSRTNRILLAIATVIVLAAVTFLVVVCLRYLNTVASVERCAIFWSESHWEHMQPDQWAAFEAAANREIAVLGGPSKAAPRLAFVVAWHLREKPLYTVPVMMLRYCGPEALPLLTRMLDNRSDEVRRAAAFVLGELKDRRAVEPLFAAAHDRNSNVRAAAIDALGVIGDERAVSIFRQVLAGGDYSPVCAVAAKWLGRMRVTDAINDLGAVLRSKDPRLSEDSQLVKEAVVALGLMKDPRAVRLLPLGFRNLFVESTSLTFRALIANDRVQSVQAIMAHRSDSNPYMRNWVANTLGAIGDESTVDALIDSYLNTDPSISLYALYALKDDAGPAAVPGVLKRMKSGDAGVRDKMLSLLCSMHEEMPEAIPPLVAIFESAPNKTTRKLAYSAMLALSGQSRDSIPVVVWGLTNEDRDIVELAGNHLYEMRYMVPIIADDLRRMLIHKNVVVRSAALRYLSEGGSATKAAVPGVIAALKDPSFEIQNEASQALKYMVPDTPGAAPRKPVTQADIPRLIEQFKASGGGGFEPLSTAGPIVAPALVELLNPPDDKNSWYQWAAAEMLGRYFPESAELSIPALAKWLSRNGVTPDSIAQNLVTIDRPDLVIPVLTPVLTDFIQMDSSSLEAQLIWGLRHEDSFAPRQAAYLLGCMETKAAKAVPTLVAALRCKQAYGVRAKAAWALGRIGSNSPEVVATLDEAAAKDTFWRVRAQAAQALKRIRALKQARSASE